MIALDNHEQAGRDGDNAIAVPASIEPSGLDKACGVALGLLGETNERSRDRLNAAGFAVHSENRDQIVVRRRVETPGIRLSDPTMKAIGWPLRLTIEGPSARWIG